MDHAGREQPGGHTRPSQGSPWRGAGCTPPATVLLSELLRVSLRNVLLLAHRAGEFEPGSAGPTGVLTDAVGLVRCAQQVFAGPRHPGADRADGTSANAGCFGVGKAEDLGENQGFSALRF